MRYDSDSVGTDIARYNATEKTEKSLRESCECVEEAAGAFEALLGHVHHTTAIGMVA